ncbi:tetratricopeptide repeat protein [Hymenobacter pini]|uniref:tetratricopeptide repeat protein n=1 Tax=Hymenobacter pini TaxID=2880879 RepID=UPI001CF2073C|nr:hypothetical protein [Hymenobacter pini]MCA8833237.1 hypothetical protein [Hymenobacter pini]
MNALDDLFNRLRTATTPTEIEALQEGIWQIWLTTDHRLLDKHLEAGMRALSAEEYSVAIREFTELTEAAPEYAEGWNKRATAYYLRGEFKASLRDVAETLRHEPRHFGALSGWATILRIIGDQRGALQVLRRLEKLCPAWPGLQNQLRDLEDE